MRGVSLQVKDDGQQEHEAGNSQIDPLDVLERLLVVADMIENDERSNDGGNDCSNAVERLREVNPDFAVFRRPANSDIRVCSSLETTQSIANDEDSGAKAAEGAV